MIQTLTTVIQVYSTYVNINIYINREAFVYF